MDLHVSEGITLSQIQTLISYSATDEIILKTTTDNVRFRDEEIANTWLNNRNVYVLSDDSRNLLGIVWFGEKEMPDANYPKDFDPNNYQITFGIRIYGPARGKGFSQRLYEEGLNLYKKTNDYKRIKNKNIWLSTNVDNLVAISLYKKLGFVKIADDCERGKILMV